MATNAERQRAFRARRKAAAYRVTEVRPDVPVSVSADILGHAVNLGRLLDAGYTAKPMQIRQDLYRSLAAELKALRAVLSPE